MNYSELSGMAAFYPWAASMKEKVDAANVALMADRQIALNKLTGVRVGDFVIDGDKTLRAAHHWGDYVQLTDGRFGASFYMPRDGNCDFSGGLNPGISVGRFVDTGERRNGPVWFFSEESVRAHNGYHTEAEFKVWKLA